MVGGWWVWIDGAGVVGSRVGRWRVCVDGVGVVESRVGWWRKEEGCRDRYVDTCAGMYWNPK